MALDFDYFRKTTSILQMQSTWPRNRLLGQVIALKRAERSKGSELINFRIGHDALGTESSPPFKRAIELHVMV